MTAKTLMILGTMSSAGKSLLVTGLCRLYARRGIRVCPFKAQNMSNNAAVCSGGEIGRAQAVQAYASGIEPYVDMNPILLKPEADSRSQVVIHGKVLDTLSAGDYYSRRQNLWQSVTESIDRLKEKYDLLILEGAGSPAEINLRKNDVVNLAAARYASAPCLLAGDIDRGGVFAQLLGTLWLLDDEDNRLIRGLIVNKFRGDANLFSDGIRMLEEKSGRPVIGVVPFIHSHGMAEEDAAVITHSKASNPEKDIAVIHLPHISNFDDLDPLQLEEGVNLHFTGSVDQLINPAAIIIPGSKSTISDMQWLKENGLSQRICELAAGGTAVVGICGGYQILGKEITDEQGVESNLMSIEGLGLLPVTTTLLPTKTTTRSQASILAGTFLQGICGQPVSGYEIHTGQTRSIRPLFEIKSRENNPVNEPDGSISENGRIWGTYLHGIFENDNLRTAWLESLNTRSSGKNFKAARSASYDRLADVLESSLNMPQLDAIIEEGVQ